MRFTSSDSQATLPADTTFTFSDRGVRTFSGLVLRTPGVQTVTATDTVSGAILGNASITVQAVQLTASGPAHSNIEQSISSTVVLRNSSNDVVTDYRGTVRFTSDDPAASLPADTTFTASDAGSRTFSGIVLRTPGQHTVTITDLAASSIVGSFTVQVHALSLNLSAVDNIQTGVSQSITISVNNDANAIASDYLRTVHFTSSDSLATLPANYTFTAADLGQHTFIAGLNLRSIGMQTVTAVDTDNNTIFGTIAINVTAQAVYWDGGGNDLLWNNPLNWSTDTLPGPTNDVIIGNGSSSLTVSLN